MLRSRGHFSFAGAPGHLLEGHEALADLGSLGARLSQPSAGACEAIRNNEYLSLTLALTADI